MSEEYAYRSEVEELEQRSATAARLFDVRRIIGGLFVIYAIIVLIAGFTASDADVKKAAGININLWTGWCMLAVGLLFLLWMKLRPLSAPGTAPKPETGPEGGAGTGTGPETGTGPGEPGAGEG
ncbi:hypothetical protein ADL28_17865 [Streptomyces violaceusniger]|uniref:Uncharacterized protein n=2 Tax=Streptomyces violaceusniger group TaxID=2839105 RepID=A0ABD5JK70_9ACTN|nr:hypothetical protein [Streptomyces violaceusniger]KUL59358.1 hypothetical protein ADL28_17865 [Streptomyces violaceusniger]MEE4588304.1 hypothetical protein [Streptomyces sp. DSM 41602]WTA83616.1 hypothetical protein OG751_29110 [Streptomyces antimycoticus]